MRLDSFFIYQILIILYFDQTCTALSNLTIEDIVLRECQPQRLVASWNNANELIYRLDDGPVASLSTIDYTVINVTTFPNSSVFDEYFEIHKGLNRNIQAWYLSPSKQHVAFTFQRLTKDEMQVYFVADVKFEHWTPVTDEQDKIESVSTFQWHPYNDSFVFITITEDETSQVLFYQRSPNDIPQKIETLRSTQARFGTSKINPDGLLIQASIRWSSDGQYLLYDVTDMSRQKRFSYSQYGNALHDSYLYPKIVSEPYTLSYDSEFPIPTVSLYVWTPEITQPPQLIVPPQEVRDIREYVLSGAAFLQLADGQEDLLTVIWNDRTRSNLYYAVCSVKGTCRLLYHVQETHGWIEQAYAIDMYSIVQHSANSFFTILPLRVTNESKFNHVAQIDFNLTETQTEQQASTSPTFWTRGEYEVMSIEGYDAHLQTLYFIAATPNGTRLNFYQVLAPTNGPSVPKCLSCDTCNSLPYRWGVPEVPMSSNFNSYLLHCSGPGVPVTVVKDLPSNAVKFVVTENNHLNELVAQKVQPSVEYGSITENGITAQYKLLIPPHRFAKNKYPLLLYVYAGPNSNKFEEGWMEFNLQTYFAATRGYVVAMIDARGCGRRGTMYRYPVYRNLGTLEIEDQITFTKLLIDKYSFIDRNKVGVRGWSYGGFATLHILKQDKGATFKCGSSGAPVTDFGLYHQSFTERYMGLWSSNIAGYNNTNVMFGSIDGLAHARLQLIHGTGDNNVHFQNSVLLAKRLIAEYIQFDFTVYPDDNHHVANAYHLYNLIDDFFYRCFDSASVDEGTVTCGSYPLLLLMTNVVLWVSL